MVLKNISFLQMLTLEGLSVYWNCGSTLFTEPAITRSEMLDKFREEYASKNDHRIKYKRSKCNKLIIYNKYSI